MTTLRAEYDGRVFVPCERIELPIGTRVEVWVPGAPRKPTPEEQRQWDEILAELNSREPSFRTVDEALRQSRKRP